MTFCTKAPIGWRCTLEEGHPGPHRAVHISMETLPNKWLHKDSGGSYVVMAQGTMQAEDTNIDLVHVTVYQGLDGRVWVRPTQEFDERFTRVV